jgi:hypothetical protein
MIENFFKWMNKHDFFISGIIFSMNTIAGLQSLEHQDYKWATINFVVALAFLWIYVKNVNKEEPKYKE